MPDGKSHTTAFDQMAARPVDDKSLAAWLATADALAEHILPGQINWTMITRSLIAEIERLRTRVAILENDLGYANNGFVKQGGTVG